MVTISEGIERCPALIDLALTVAIVGDPRARRVQKKWPGTRFSGHFLLNEGDLYFTVTSMVLRYFAP